MPGRTVAVVALALGGVIAPGTRPPNDPVAGAAPAEARRPGPTSPRPGRAARTGRHGEPAGAGTATYTSTCTVSQSATGTISNTAVVTAPASVIDPDPTDNTSTDKVAPRADLSMARTDDRTTAVPGQPVTYTLTAANAGPSNVAGARVSDALPAALLGATWTCAASPFSTRTASGSGSIDDTVSLRDGGRATYTLTAIVDPVAAGTQVNTAAIAAPGGTTDPAPGNNSETDTDALVPGSGSSPPSGSASSPTSPPGVAAHVDRFRLRQELRASYEVVVDEASGDLGSSGPLLERVGSDSSTVLQTSQATGVGFSRSPRRSNGTGDAATPRGWPRRG